jgi:3-dehydroquinate dehydratase type I
MDQFFPDVRSAEEGMKSFLSAMSAKPRHPVIATCRPVREMGLFAGREDIRLSMLEEAAKAGADWIDLEHDVDAANIARFREAGAKVLVSWHNHVETPSMEVLRIKLESMRKTGADALKIVTMALSDIDNLRVAGLIPIAREEFEINLIAFCMGPIGRWSRLVSLFLGSPWTYARFEDQSESAPGQLTVSEMRAMLKFFH